MYPFGHTLGQQVLFVELFGYPFGHLIISLFAYRGPTRANRGPMGPWPPWPKFVPQGGQGGAWGLRGPK